MEDEIATTQLKAKLPSGEICEITIRIGRPRMEKKNAVCPLALEGIDPRIHNVCGEDTYQALNLAMRLIYMRLDGLEKVQGWHFDLNDGNSGDDSDSWTWRNLFGFQ